MSKSLSLAIAWLLLFLLAAASAERNAHDAPLELALEMGDEQLTWRALERKTSRIAHVLRAHGVRPGDVLALVGTNSPTYVAIVLAATRAGAAEPAQQDLRFLRFLTQVSAVPRSPSLGSASSRKRSNSVSTVWKTRRPVSG